MEFQNVQFRAENGVGYITIDHPPANALNAATIRDLSECFDYASQETNIRVMVITGAGKFFVAGADIKEFVDAFDNAKKGEEIALAAQRLFMRIEQSEKPVIAAINGACLGGGLELAMSCHMRIAAQNAKLGQPELNLSVIPGFGGTQRLARLTNQAKALELILTSQPIDGTEAERIGLVNRAVPLDELMSCAKQLAEKISLEKSSVAVRAATKAVTRGMQTSLEEGLALEAQLFGQMFCSEDMKEGVRAFLEKRPAVFQNR